MPSRVNVYNVKIIVERFLPRIVCYRWLSLQNRNVRFHPFLPISAA
jgi:hypothetical protein